MNAKPKFRKEETNGFYHELKAEVTDLVNELDSETDHLPAIKMFILGACYIGACIMINTSADTIAELYMSYAVAGLLMVLLVLNVVHEASHNTLFKKTLYNQIAIWWLELFGTDSTLYKKRHIVYHHTYPNVSKFDADLSQNSLVRVIPHDEYKKHHRFQPLYLPFLYLLFSLNWFLVRDFNDFFTSAEKFGLKKSKLLKLLIQKVLVICVWIIMPYLLSDLPLWMFITGFIIYHVSASILAVVAVGCAHVNEDAEFPVPDKNNRLKDTWAVHQLKTTQDFATDNPLVNVSFGGFNFHVAHHLFPNLPSRHYEKVTRVIREKAFKYGLEYKYKPMLQALVSHFRLIISNSTPIPQPDM